MKLIDISHEISEKSPIYPGDEKLVLKKIKSLAENQYVEYNISSNFHVGTHIDAPMHLIEDEKYIGNYSIDNFYGNGVMLDVKNEKIIKYKDIYDELVLEKSIVLLYTGFDKYYGTPQYYENHPVVSEELCDFLISKKIKMLGMDMPSPDPPPFLVHKKILENNIFIIENLTNLHLVKKVAAFDVIAFPLKIMAEASFSRVVCVIK